MPTIDVTQEFTAPTTKPVKMFQGQQYVLCPYDALVEFAVVAAQTGSADVASPEVVATIYSGSDLLVEDGNVYVETKANGLKVEYPESFLYTDAAFKSERLSVGVSVSGPGTPENSSIAVRAVARITQAPPTGM